MYQDVLLVVSTQNLRPCCQGAWQHSSTCDDLTSTDWSSSCEARSSAKYGEINVDHVYQRQLWVYPMSLFQCLFPILYFSINSRFFYACPFKNPLDLGVNDLFRLFLWLLHRKKKATGTSSTANPLGSSLAASCRVGNVLPAWTQKNPRGFQCSNSLENNKQQRNILLGSSRHQL